MQDLILRFNIEIPVKKCFLLKIFPNFFMTIGNFTKDWKKVVFLLFQKNFYCNEQLQSKRTKGIKARPNIMEEEVEDYEACQK